MQTISSVLSFFKRNPFVLFVLLAYLISWSDVRRTGGWIISWGPMLAALFVVGLTTRMLQKISVRDRTQTALRRRELGLI